ncbi:ribosomal-protein-alanine N-acetyltransferase [Candidatus Bathyarchaeota archaeon]|nr:MAG: ribosomal-protein-alanine N-acetyltransferase [Candidatus Bathyarchaeota archaeon]
MDDGVVVRGFRPEDLEAVHEIERRSFPDPWPRSLFKALHRSPGTYFLVATLKERVVGYALGRVEQIPQRETAYSGSRKIGHILNIAVSPELRRSGIGMKLMRTLEALLKRGGASLARLEVRASNIAAQRFYRRLGYREGGRIPLYYGDEDALVMEKGLGRAPTMEG